MDSYHPVQSIASSLASPIQQTSHSGNDLYLKVLCPENKKEYKTVTLRGLSEEKIDTPEKLKEAISVQCDGLDPQNMEIGYFVHSKKIWINSRLDLDDVWSMVRKQDKVTLWCLNTTPRESQKRKHDEEPVSKRHKSQQGPGSSVEERKAQAKENEEKLLEMHKDKWTIQAMGRNHFI